MPQQLQSIAIAPGSTSSGISIKPSYHLLGAFVAKRHVVSLLAVGHAWAISMVFLYTAALTKVAIQCHEKW